MIIAAMLISAVAKVLYTSCPLKLKQEFVDKIEEKFQKKVKDRDPVKNELDGKFLSCQECGGSGNCGTADSGKTDAPKNGKRPPGCTATKLKKIVFVNGILNDPKDNCATSKKLAETMCCEALSFYNTSDGAMGDLSECVKNIKGANNEPAARLEEYLAKHEGEDITIVAHSQGGLITRQALNSRQADLIRETGSSNEANKKLSSIKVISCGTAENGWPEGPSYEQYTNRLDVVPKAIAEADEIYSVPKTNDENILRHKFIGWKPSDVKGGGHTMDGVYMPRIAENEKGKTPTNDCLTCPKKSYLKSA